MRATRRHALLAMLALPGIALGAPGAATAGDILVVHSYHAGYGWDEAWQASLAETLGDHTLHTVYMDTKRLPESKFDARADRAWQTFRERSYDAVVVGDDNALDLLGERIARATDVPVIFLGINANPRGYFSGMRLPANVSGILERPLLGLNVRLVRQFLPDSQSMLVLLDKGVTGDAAAEQIGNVKAALRDFAVTIKRTHRFAAWKKAVRRAKANGHDVIAPALYFRQVDPHGEAVPADRVIGWTHEHTPVPLIGFWEFTVGPNKAMAGMVLDGETMGHAAGTMLREALTTGTVPEPRTVRGGKLLVSRSGVARWDLDIPTLENTALQLVP